MDFIYVASFFFFVLNYEYTWIYYILSWENSRREWFEFIIYKTIYERNEEKFTGLEKYKIIRIWSNL